MPSNSLSVLHSLAHDARERQVLGSDVEFEISTIDETNTHVNVRKIAAQFKSHDNFGLVCLVGVQSNEYPRALDLATKFREKGIPVIIGGFHVAGCLAMFSEIRPELQQAIDLGISLFAGEAEGHFDEVLLDAANDTSKPIYRYLVDLPDLQTAITPFLPETSVKNIIGNVASFDAGRGCPYQCSFCTIINVQGRKSRFRSPDNVEAIIRQNLSQGIDRFFITDDNYARNKNWEPIFDRIIYLREEEGLDVRFMIQVDTLCHKIPNFMEKAKRAGVTRVFIGLENINPENLLAAQKRQNKITEYRDMLLGWKRVGIMTFAGYILGFPNDTPDSIRRDLEIIKKELPLELLELFVLTPLPGSQDHQELYHKGGWMDDDLNKYDVEHVVADHAKMTREEWQKIYWDSWDIYYSPEHIETILRRAKASETNTFSVMVSLIWFSSMYYIERVHPLQGGLIRIKRRKVRRAGLPIESPFVFYPRYTMEILTKTWKLFRKGWQINRLRRRINADPQAASYMDLALTPVGDDDEETLEMFTQTDAAQDAVKRLKKIDDIKSSAAE